MVPAIVESTARAAEVTFGVVLIHACHEATTDTGVLDGNTCLSITCADCGSFSSTAACSVPDLLFVAVVKMQALDRSVVADTVEELSSTSVCYGSRFGDHTLVSAPRSSHRGLKVVFYFAVVPLGTSGSAQVTNKQALW